MATAQNDLQNIYGTLAGRANVLGPTLGSLTSAAPGAADVYRNAFANMNTAQGLSPEALSALRTQGTSGINDQYQSAAQALNTQLLRRGAVGQGALPSSGGDISRAYQPLYTAMEQAKSKAQTDTILADEAAKRASLTENRTNALSAANSLFGNTGSIFNASNAPLGAAAGVANSIADLEGPSIGKLFGTSLLSSALSGQGGLFSGGGTNGTGNGGLLGDALGRMGIGNVGTDIGGYTRQALDMGGGTALQAALGTGAPAAGGITGALGLGGGAGMLGLGAATIPVIGAAAVGIGLLAKKLFGNGGDRMAANELTGPNGVHAFFDQATQQINAMPNGPEKDSAINARDRSFEQALLGFSQIDKDHYYQAKQTLRQFSQFSTVKALLG